MDRFRQIACISLTVVCSCPMVVLLSGCGQLRTTGSREPNAVSPPIANPASMWETDGSRDTARKSANHQSITDLISSIEETADSEPVVVTANRKIPRKSPQVSDEELASLEVFTDPETTAWIQEAISGSPREAELRDWLGTVRVLNGTDAPPRTHDESPPRIRTDTPRQTLFEAPRDLVGPASEPLPARASDVEPPLDFLYVAGRVNKLWAPAPVYLMSPTARNIDSTRTSRFSADRRRSAMESFPADETNEFAEPNAAGQWQADVERAIEALSYELRSNQVSEDDISRYELRIRLLHLLTGNPDELVKMVEGLSPAEQRFWQQQLMGLRAMLDDERHPVESKRVTVAMDRLQQGLDHLSEISSLHVHNAAFCRDIAGFGKYDRFETNAFRSGEQVLLYVEVDHFAAEELRSSSSGKPIPYESPDEAAYFETQLEANYEIFDDEQRRVADRPLPVNQERCRNRRRDYFIGYRIYLPELPTGKYLFQLTMRDTKGNKYGQAMIDFRIK